MKNNESYNKYVCGLLDGNGCFCVGFTKSTLSHYNTSINLTLCLPKTNRHSLKTLQDIRDYFGYGSVSERAKGIYVWSLNGGDVVNVFDRIGKHLVVKGGHAKRSIDMYNKYKGTREVDEEKRTELREYLKWSRENTGPLKPKKHISKAWFAGFVDSDGCVRTEIRTRVNKYGKTIKYFNGELRFCQHPKDHHAIELIASSFGREWKMNQGYMNLVFHMGNRTKHTAERVLVPLIPHLRLKRWDAEQIMYHLNHPQRLNSDTSTDEVIVQ